MRIFKKLLISLVVIFIVIIFAFKFFLQPNIWLIRYVFNKDAVKTNMELEKNVPENILSLKDIQYDKKDTDAFLDVYFPKRLFDSLNKLPTIVWTHGGGFVSGNKNQVGNYCKLLASKGYTVIAVDYTIAPKKKYPTPIAQLNKALSFISSNPDLLHADTSFIVLGGDSGGAMISAIAANIITNPNYADNVKFQPGIKANQLKGLVLFCGVYNMKDLKTTGLIGHCIKNVNWAFFGTKDITDNDYATTAIVTKYLTRNFPTSFISAGNKDPLLLQSKLLAQKLNALNIHADTLFFDNDENLNLPHEYQFTMDSCGKLAFDQTIKFLKSIEKK
jgi:acetyl esterase